MFVWTAEEELIRRCMADAGFEFPTTPPDRLRPSPGAHEYGVRVEDASTVGYDIQAELALAAEDPNGAEYTELDGGGREAWGVALFGPDDAPRVEVDVPLIGTRTGASTAGCLAEARATLYGDVESWIMAETFTGNFVIAAASASGADPDLAALNEEWADCMDDAGITPELESPDAARGHVRGLYADGDRATARQSELTIATADARCEADLDYERLRDRIEDLYLTAAADDHEGQMTAITEIYARATKAAESVLARQP